MYYNNYHKHSHYSNIKTLDVVVKVEDYLQRMVELGHRNYFTTEHGYQGYLFEVLTLIDDWNKRLPDDKKLKMVVGTEAYFVEDVSLKHRGYHLVIIALNNKGVEGINELLTEANVRGLYYKPRVDFEMIEKFLDPNSVIITSACVAGIGAKWYENSFNTIKWFKDRFKDNFYLEIQSHNHPVQIEHNKKMKELSRKLQIQLIHANDSHYIKPEDSYYRDMFLKGKDMIKDVDKNDDNEYKAEMDFILDYPEYNEILTRYQQQGVFSNSEAMKALENTRVFDRCEEITIYNDDIKIPKISENPLQELKNILNEE